MYTILVFFRKTKEVVLYKSDVHKDKKLVRRLLNKLRGENVVAEESESEEESTDDDQTTQPLDVVDHG
jgi:hypothetical protein